MLTPRQDHSVMTRIQPAAERELAEVLKRVPAEHRQQAAAVAIHFADRPTRKQIEAGIAPETVTMQDRQSECVTVFLMPLFERYGAEPGAFRHELQRCLLQSIADAIGQDWDLSEP